jgi:predicted amino acid racemase/predicted NBD/HSP70 family sugar kinase
VFLKRMLADNPRLPLAAVRAHQAGRLLSGTYLIDLDALSANAALLADAAAAAGLRAYFMAKQFGRNPDACRAAVRAGLPTAVAVDLQCLEAETRHGIPVGHAGHLVQPHRGSEAATIAARPEVVTVFTADAARRVGTAALAAGRVQDVLLRVQAPGDHFYFGHGGGFPLDAIEEAARTLRAIPGVRVTGVTTFPCLLADPARRTVHETHNLGTLAEAARRLRAAGTSITQVNAPGTTSAGTMETLAKAGATHAEPGNALHGTTPLHIFDPTAPEIPAIAYVSEVSHFHDDDAYVFASGYYIDKALGDYPLTALCGNDESLLERRLPVRTAAEGAIHYYAVMPEGRRHGARPGDTVVFCFRPQAFVTRARTQAITGLAAGTGDLLTRYDQEARPVQGISLPADIRKSAGVVPQSACSSGGAHYGGTNAPASRTVRLLPRRRSAGHVQPPFARGCRNGNFPCRRGAKAGVITRPRLTRADTVLAIDFGGTKIAVGCAEAGGRILACRRIPTHADRGARQAVDRALALAARLASEVATRDRRQLAAVAVVSPGVVLPERVLLAPNVPGWHDLALPGLVRHALPGLPIVTGNDVQAAALAELRWGQLRGIRNGLYVNIGTGLAAAMVVDGRLVTGANRAAGEIGYARLDDGHGAPALLEQVIGGLAIAQRAGAAAGRPLTAADAFASKDPQVMAVVDSAISEFGRHLANFATLLDAERVVIGGGLMNDADRVLPPVRRRLTQIVPFPPDAVPGAFITDAALRGAAALAADAVSGGGDMAPEDGQVASDQDRETPADAAAHQSPARTPDGTAP